MKPIADISNRLAFLGHLLGGFDLEFFEVTLTTLGSFYLGLIVRLRGVYGTRSDSGIAEFIQMTVKRPVPQVSFEHPQD